MVKNLPAKAEAAGDAGSTPESGRFPCRRKWQLSPVFLPGESHGQGSLVGYGPWGLKELDMTVITHACMYMQPLPVIWDFWRAGLRATYLIHVPSTRTCRGFEQAPYSLLAYSLQ